MTSLLKSKDKHMIFKQNTTTLLKVYSTLYSKKNSNATFGALLFFFFNSMISSLTTLKYYGYFNY